MSTGNIHLWLLRARWELRRSVARMLRTFGPAALLTAALSAGTIVLGAWSWSQGIRAARLGVEIEEQLRRPASPAESARVEATAADIEAALPGPDSPPAIVQQLIALAQREKLALPAGEYKFSGNDTSGVQSYRMRLPMSGDAAAIQRFVLRAVNEHRTLGVESLQMRREKVEAADVEASVQFVLLTSASRTRVTGGGAR